MKLSKAPNVGVVIAIGLLIAFLTRSTWERFIFADSIEEPLRKSDTKSVASYTPADYDKAASKCLSLAQFDCAETNWEHYLTLRPNDGQAWAKLGIARNRHDDHEAALVAFERAISLGEGTYDLFAYYADSLAASGRTEDAVNWYYKALVVVPSLVDVRGKLAKLLVLQKKYYEALSLLESFDAELRVKGSPAYFEGQRIAIETALERNEGNQTAETSLRLPKYESHFYAPVRLGSSRPEPFVVDTGASVTALDEAKLLESKAHFKWLKSDIVMRTADGRTVATRGALLDSLTVGPYVLRDVSVVTCRGCVSLLGQSTLSKFDLKSAKISGVEFLTLSLRR